MTGAGATGPVRSRRPMPWWLLAPVFALGLLIGGVIIGLLSSSSPASVAAPTTTPTAAPPTTAHSAEIIVDQSCLDTLASARDLLGDVADIRSALQTALTHFDLSGVNALLAEIDAAQNQLRTAASGCRVQVRLPDGSLVATSVPGLGAAGPTT